ncbi:MAG: cell division protein FtsA [Alphaproteobacteria bacterium]
MSLHKKKRPARPRDYLAALDIGSSKISCMIARVAYDEVNTAPQLHLLGTGQQISRGLKNGTIIDMEALEDAILNSVHSAEQQADVVIEEVLVSLPSQSIVSQMVTNEVPVGNQAIDEGHIRRLMNVESLVPPDLYLIHALPIEYYVDQTKGIKDPRGLCGEKLGIKLHLILAPQGLIRNLSRCIGRCHLDVAGFVASPLASGLATLVEDELQLGVMLVDLGGGGTSIACFIDGNLVHMSYVPLGGLHVTHDIARGLSTPIAQAERLKTLYGSVLTTTDERENILIPILGEDQTAHINQVPKSFLTHIIRSRVEETFGYLTQTLKGQHLNHLLAQRIVLTGGASQLSGLRDFMVAKSGKSVRLGIPQGLRGSQDIIHNPAMATCIGLLHYATQEQSNSRDAVNLAMSSGNVFRRAYQWVVDNF